MMRKGSLKKKKISMYKLESRCFRIRIDGINDGEEYKRKRLINIMKELLTLKKKSFKTIQVYAIKHKQWVEMRQFPYQKYLEENFIKSSEIIEFYINNFEIFQQNKRAIFKVKGTMAVIIYFMQAYKLPDTLNSSQKPSFFIIVLDGTGSMHGEYQLMLQAYYSVFQDEINKGMVHAIQFGTQITALEPFQSAGSGNFNTAFLSVLQKLEENLKADITICVVSDGHEYSNISEIEQQINSAKKRYQIQFTSIAVGKDYPFALFQQFRTYFHNGAESCPPVQVVDRANATGSSVCKENFIQKFKMIKSLLKQQSLVEVKQEIYQSIGSLPSHQAQSGSVVLSKSQSIQIADGREVKETRHPAHITEILQTSSQQFIIRQEINKFQNVQEEAKEMFEVANKLIQKIDQTASPYKNEVKEVIEIGKKNIQFLEGVSKGEIQLDKLSDAEKTKLQESFNPKKDEIQQASQCISPQQKEAFEQQLISLINEKSTQPGSMVLLSVLSDFVEDAIADGKSKQDIISQLKNSKKLSLKTLQVFTTKNSDWVEKFVDCYIKII